MKVIIISGPSGSGKTTLANQISRKIKNSIVLSTDNYYKTDLVSKLTSKFIKSYFDRKISFNYKLFKEDFNYIIKYEKFHHKYVYDFKNKNVIKQSKKINMIQFLIIEGIFTEYFIREVKIDNFFFIKMKFTKEFCMKRVIKRDVNERGKNKKIAKNEFLNSWDIFHKNIKYNILVKEWNNFLFTDNSELNLLLEKIINSAN